jgi:Lon protease-like protein
MFPLSTVLFPHSELPLHVFEPRFRELTSDCLADDREFGIVLIERGPEVGGGDARCSVGSLARITSATPLADGRMSLVVEATRRFRVRRWTGEEPYPTALIEELPDGSLDADDDLLERAFGAVRRARALLSELGETAALPFDADLGESAEETSWRLCALAPLTPFDAQRLLELDDPVERLRALEALCQAFGADLHRLLAGG